MSNFFVEASKEFSYCLGMNDKEILDAIRDGRSRAWLARTLGIPYHAFYAWYRRGRIPARYRAAVMAMRDRMVAK